MLWHTVVVMTRLELLKKHRQAIGKIAERHGARDLRAFGSVARQEDRSGSDIDLLVHLERGRTYFDYVRLKRELEEYLHCPIDLVLDTAIKPILRKEILRTAMPL